MNEEQAQSGRLAVERFLRRFPGSTESYRALACHAALPFLLTPDLLNYLRCEFLKDQTDWVAEADLLLSDLCEEVGYEQYAMKLDARAWLLQEMKQDEKLGPARMEEVARRLLRWVGHAQRGESRFRPETLQAQRWGAMVYLQERREDAVREMAVAFTTSVGLQARAVAGEDLVRVERLRVSEIIQDLAHQLGEYAELVEYAEATTRILTGIETPIEFTSSVSVAGVELPPLISLRRQRSPIETLRVGASGLEMTSARTLIDAGQFEQAEKYAFGAVNLTPSDRDAWQLLAEAIRGNSSNQGLDELLRLFHSNSPLFEDPRVRRNLAVSLGIICGPPAVASPFVRLVLLRLTQDSEPGVREAAETSLNSFIQVGTPIGKEWRSLVPFEFQTVTLNARGKEIQRHALMARQFLEDLAPDVFLEMVEVPGGTFVMGSPESEEGRQSTEGPQRKVSVPPFFIGKFTITQAQWRVVAGWAKVEIDLELEPSRFKGNDRPVDSVSWNNVKEFCARLSKKTGRAYRLPSEVEWEYACRAGTTTPFAFGETITPKIVNYDGNFPYAKAKKGKRRLETIPVGSLGIANAFGLYDMNGNVWEWCEDAYIDNYKNMPLNGSPRLNQGSSSRVLRGGSYLNFAVFCRSTNRYWSDARLILPYVGVRVVVSASTLD